MTNDKSQWWDAKALHKVVHEQWGTLEGCFEAHSWPERGSDMMTAFSGRVVKLYGDIETFVEKWSR